MGEYANVVVRGDAHIGTHGYTIGRAKLFSLQRLKENGVGKGRMSEENTYKHQEKVEGKRKR